MSLGKTRSPVWNYFEIDSSNQLNAICKICRKIIKRGKTLHDCSTSPLTTHLRTNHAELYSKFEKNNNLATTSSTASVSTLASTSTTSRQPTLSQCLERNVKYEISHPKAVAISKRIGEMIAVDLQPFSIVEDSGFRHLLALLEPRYTLPSAKYFTRVSIEI